MIIYADFTSAYCYLASLRVDRLIAVGQAPVDWRAVQHRPGLPRPGLSLDGLARVIRGRELAAARCLLHHREEFEARNPRFLPHTGPANAAYAIARARGFGDEARRVLFDAFWVKGLHIGRPEVVQSLLPRTSGPHLVATAETEAWQTEWMNLGTCLDLTILSPHHAACGRAAVEELAGKPLRVA